MSSWLSMVTERLSKIAQLIRQMKRSSSESTGDNVLRHSDNSNTTIEVNNVGGSSDDVSGTKPNVADDGRTAGSLCGTSESHAVTFVKR